jgi:hypothetical protein
MATFCIDGWPKLTILVDGTNITMVSKECLCARCQHRSLHIFKDVTYDANNNVFSLVYQMFIVIVQGQEWVMNSGHYKVVGDIFTRS